MDRLAACARHAVLYEVAQCGTQIAYVLHSTGCIPVLSQHPSIPVLSQYPSIPRYLLCIRPQEVETLQMSAPGSGMQRLTRLVRQSWVLPRKRKKAQVAGAVAAPGGQRMPLAWCCPPCTWPWNGSCKHLLPTGQSLYLQVSCTQAHQELQ